MIFNSFLSMQRHRANAKLRRSWWGNLPPPPASAAKTSTTQKTGVLGHRQGRRHRWVWWVLVPPTLEIRGYLRTHHFLRNIFRVS